MFGLRRATWVRLVVWHALGMVVYAAYGRTHAVAVRASRTLEAAVGD